MSLVYQPVQVPLVAGLDTKDDVRFSSPPKLDIAKDLQMEEIGGIQTRPPMSAMATAVLGGGSLSSCRRLATVNGELCLFTNDALYSWSPQRSAWVSRGTHLAVATDESPRFVTTGDQIDADRAELNGTVVYAWTEGTQVYAAAMDKDSESVLVSPTAVSTAVSRPRLVALTSKILLFVDAGSNNLTARAIDPASPGTAIAGAGTTVLATNYNAYYDAERVPGSDTAVVASRRTTTTAYSVLKVTAALAVTAVTPARTCDGPITVAVDPTGTNVQIVRGNGTNVQGDLLLVSTLADVFTGQAIGTGTLNQITAAYSTVQSGGFYVASVFWSRSEASTGSTGDTSTNTVNTNNSVGSASTLVQKVGLGSRAFAALGRVFVWTVFARTNEITGFSGATAVGLRAALQNTYFLYRDDGLLVGKALPATAGGHCPSTGRLPAVTQTDVAGLKFAWCGTARRIIDLGNSGKQTGYAARQNVEIPVEFDSDSARRVASLGRTAYVTGSLPLQYDGAGLFEVGFLTFPYQMFLTIGGAGAIGVGDYFYTSTFAWPNAQAERERSTSAFTAKITSGGGIKHTVQLAALNVTRKTAARIAPTCEVWRSEANPATGAPLYLDSGIDPNTLAGSGALNAYIPNDYQAAVLPSTGFFIFQDNYTDAQLRVNEPNPDNEGILEHLAPPGASLIAATDTRILLGDVSGDHDRVWPSLERNDGEIAAFNDAIPVDVSTIGGEMTAIWLQDGTIYVGRETAIYALPGDGVNNLGQGQNFGPPQEVSLDVGPVSQEAQALTPVGTVFKSRKGWYLMDRGRNLRYIGGPVGAFDSDTVKAVTVVSNRHQVRVLTDQRMLVWDYRGAVDANTPEAAGNWFEWSITGGLDACMWNGSYVYLTSTGPRIEQTAYTGLTYGIDVEPSWLKMRDLQGYGKVGALLVLGEYRSDFLLRVRLARDYQYDGSGNVVYYDDRAWAPTQTTVGSAFQVRHTPSASYGNCEAIKYRLTAVAEGTRATLVTTALSPQLATSGSAWNARWRAEKLSSGAVAYGEMGNRITMTIAFAAPDTGTLLPVDLPFTFEQGVVAVRDGFTWSTTASRWIEDPDNIGIVITGDVTVADLETAIAASTDLASLSLADPLPTKIVSYASQFALGSAPVGQFSGGAYTAPTGEAMKLTGVALEVGIDPRVFKRLSAGQKQ